MAANRERGEKAIMVKDKEYILVLTTFAMMAVEEKSGKSWPQIIAKISAGTVTVTDAVTLLWATLQKYHSNEIKALKDAADWIDAAGGMDVVGGQLTGLVELNMEEAPKKAQHPQGPAPAAGSGTGGNSTSTPVESTV